MVNKKVILFDLDDTLYDYKKNHIKALNNVYKTLLEHISISEKEFLETYQIANKEIKLELLWTASSHNRVLYFQRLVEKLFKKCNPNKVLNLYNAYWDFFLENMEIWEWVIETIKKLKEKWIKIWIVTDLTTHIQLRKILKLGLEDYIDTLVTSEEAWKEKPAQCIFLLALNKLKAAPSEAFMVWDSLKKDIEWWNVLWMDTVYISDKTETDFEFTSNYEKPDYFIEKIPDILKII